MEIGSGSVGVAGADGPVGDGAGATASCAAIVGARGAAVVAADVPLVSVPGAWAAAGSAAERFTPLTIMKTPTDPLPISIPIPMPESGPGITQPGIFLLAWPAADGSFEVIERVRPVGTVSTVTLRPASVDPAGQQFAAASAAATQVRLSAGGQDVPVPGAEVGATTAVAVGQVDRFDLHYRLTDIAVVSTPSKSGRALAALAPLTGGMNQDLPVLIVAAGDSVLGLSCPLLSLPEQSCGSRLDNGPGFQRELPSRLALTTVQFNVPSA